MPSYNRGHNSISGTVTHPNPPNLRQCDNGSNNNSNQSDATNTDAGNSKQIVSEASGPTHPIMPLIDSVSSHVDHLQTSNHANLLGNPYAINNRYECNPSTSTDYPTRKGHSSSQHHHAATRAYLSQDTISSPIHTRTCQSKLRSNLVEGRNLFLRNSRTRDFAVQTGTDQAELFASNSRTTNTSDAEFSTPEMSDETSGSERYDLGLYPIGGVNNRRETQTEAILLYDDMKNELECPVCCKISLPPIMQCRNGHVTCNSCKVKVRSCPMCREVDIDIRNMFAEKALAYMTIPCEFNSYGCNVESLYRDRDKHTVGCKYRPYSCPYIECENKLAAADVVKHVSTVHKDDCRNSDGPEITASMILIGNFFGGDGAWSPRVITCFDGRTFFDVALTRDRWLHHWVWLLGEEEEAQNFTYEITAFKGETRYTYAGEVSSLRTPDDEIVSTGQCLSISDPIGKRLRDGDKIRYKLKLSKKHSGVP